jgi:hypothetical protein
LQYFIIQAYFLFYSLNPGSKVSFVMIPVSGWNAGLARRGNLQMMLIGRFCKFPKSKTVNYHMQVAGGD